MFKDVVETAVDDLFAHLGQEVTFKPRGESGLSLVAVIKCPESVYELGNSEVVGQVANITIKASELTPHIGDFISLGSNTYKIFEEPLLDAAGLIWKFNAVLVEG